MTNRKKEVSDQFHQLASSIDTSYESWATKNRYDFPFLFVNVEDSKTKLCPVHQNAARYYISMLVHICQECWSYAGDIMGGEISEDSTKSNNNFIHLTSMTFIPSEVARQSFNSSRLLTYQAVAHEYASVEGTRTISDEEFSKAMLNLTSVEMEMYTSLMQHLVDNLGINSVLTQDVYLPLENRREVFKRLLANLFAQLDDIETSDSSFKLMSESLHSVSSMTSNFAFMVMAKQSPCSPPGCASHIYHFEHTKAFR